MISCIFLSRYETLTLRALCEKLLVSRVEDSNVFSLLEVAEHYSLHQLKVCTHIYTPHHVLKSSTAELVCSEDY